MIIGDCPYCDNGHMIPIATNAPCWGREKCEACGKEFWLRHSRIDPQAYADDEFDAEFTVNYDTKEIQRKNPTLPLTDTQKKILDLLMEEMAVIAVNRMLYGTGTSEPKGLLAPFGLDQNGK